MDQIEETSMDINSVMDEISARKINFPALKKLYI
jgi:hypothetical protein